MMSFAIWLLLVFALLCSAWLVVFVWFARKTFAIARAWDERQRGPSRLTASPRKPV